MALRFESKSGMSQVVKDEGKEGERAGSLDSFRTQRKGGQAAARDTEPRPCGKIGGGWKKGKFQNERGSPGKGTRSRPDRRGRVEPMLR